VLVIVTLQVQHRVDDEMRAMGRQQLALLLGFAPHDGDAKHDVTVDATRTMPIMVHEREDIGGTIALAIAPVQRASLRFANEPQRDLGIAAQRGPRPAPERGRYREVRVGDGVLNRQGETRAMALQGGARGQRPPPWRSVLGASMR